MTAAGAPVSGWVLFVAFVVVPLVEIYVLIQVGQVIGAWWTILLLIADEHPRRLADPARGRPGLAGADRGAAVGRMPARELADGALILVGGTLMLTPGLRHRRVGMLLILPFTRPVARRLLTRVITAHLVRGPPRPRARTHETPDPDPRDPWSGRGRGLDSAVES